MFLTQRGRDGRVEWAIVSDHFKQRLVAVLTDYIVWSQPYEKVWGAQANSEKLLVTAQYRDADGNTGIIVLGWHGCLARPL